MKVENKVIMVTGGGNGLGREIALNLLGRGSKVVAVDISERGLAETAGLAGRHADSLMTVKADITDKDVIQSLPEKIISRFGAIDGAINNAGVIQHFRKINDMDFDDIERVFNINFKGQLNVIKAFVPYLLERPEGHVVNVSSMGGFMPVAGQGIYGASKAAVKILSESLDSELSETNVGVTTVFPGAMYTSIKANSGLGKEAGAGPEGHSANAALSPAAAAGMIINAIEHNERRLYIGKDAKSMNLLYKFMPNLAVRTIYKQMRDKI